MIPEPPDPENPLLDMDQVLYTPHTGGLSDGSSEDVGKHSAEQMLRAFKGDWPTSVQNPGVKEKLDPSKIFAGKDRGRA